MTTPRWSPEHVGMIRYSSYWGKYALVLYVNERTQTVTELDAFAGIGQHPTHGASFRIHRTPLDWYRHDKFLTVAEFYAQVINT